MSNLRYLFIAMIFAGLVLAEAVPLWSKLTSPAESQRQLSAQEQSAILSILQNGDANAAASSASSNLFPNFTPPQNPADILPDAVRASVLMSNPAPSSSPSTTNSNTSTATPNDILSGVLPPLNTDLYYAYQDGGRAWYQKGNNVLVIFPDESIRSFDTKTGKSTTWLQDRLAYPPINDPSAYTNYQKNYNAEIVAETSTWVLMEFPSGGVLKVMKPQFAGSTGP